MTSSRFGTQNRSAATQAFTATDSESSCRGSMILADSFRDSDHRPWRRRTIAMPHRCKSPAILFCRRCQPGSAFQSWPGQRDESGTQAEGRHQPEHATRIVGVTRFSTVQINASDCSCEGPVLSIVIHLFLTQDMRMEPRSEMQEATYERFE
jgi:hypothetical protein